MMDESSAALRLMLTDIVRLHNKCENDRNSIANLHEKVFKECKGDWGKISKANKCVT